MTAPSSGFAKLGDSEGLKGSEGVNDARAGITIHAGRFDVNRAANQRRAVLLRGEGRVGGFD